MAEKPPIAPSEAEHIVTEVRTEHGLGQKYRLKVEPSRRGWHVRDQKGSVESVPPMAEETWRAYLEDRFVEAITQHDETSEA
ncbi:MAG TPA: hypothetical protein VHE30_20705 [Polyangiaceae bacterium]|nr:hypothetical protein [Polyangiaceae bacterium]